MHVCWWSPRCRLQQAPVYDGMCQREGQPGELCLRVYGRLEWSQVWYVVLVDCSLKCQNEGTLDNAACKCACAGGYRGRDCSKPPCTTECVNGKVSQENCACECNEGWTGPTCACNLKCQNGGTLDQAKCRCACAGGYRGAACSLPPCTTPCINGKVNQENCACECSEGWSGPKCDCSLKCANVGSLDKDSCTCTCAGGYRGADCTQPPCKTECINGKVSQKNCACECTKGWYGPKCGELVGGFF
ncbi:wnt inhibitory factor 1-like [Haliotis cracherodii]|uniref:wnt inhibitory factor 1-like n=1 Tax=Haliotis cracherodii TaxID=6455 RepID=UPI0039ECB7F5